MLHHHPLLFIALPGNQSSPVLSHFSLFNKINGRNISRLEKLSSSCQLLRRRAVDRESSSLEEEEEVFEVDTEKARQALQKLDQQLFSLSQRQVNPPKIRAKDLDHPQPRVREEVPDFSGSFLAYSAFALLLLSIFYNVIFITVIKPSIDFTEAVEATSVGKAPRAEPMPQSPSSSEALNLRPM